MASTEFRLLKPNYPKDGRYEDVDFPMKEYRVPTGRPVRIYCDGIFDLMHYGHTRLFSQVKSLFPDVYLMVGICNDELTTTFKGSLVMNEEERYESVRSCKYVDEVVEDAPWVLDLDFLEAHGIDFVAHDEAPYPHAGTADVYQFVRERGMFIPTKRANTISTTGLITRILRDYEQFLRRQIRRGISHKELNISLLTREKIRLKDSLLSDVKCMKEEFRYALCYWEKLSRRMLRSSREAFLRIRESIERIY